MKLFRTLAVAATSTVLIAGPAVAAFACDEHQAAALTAPARSATAKYHSLTVAKKTGYSILADSAGITCIAEPQMVPWECTMSTVILSGIRRSMPRIRKPWSMRLIDMAGYTWLRWNML